VSFSKELIILVRPLFPEVFGAGPHADVFVAVSRLRVELRYQHFLVMERFD